MSSFGFRNQRGLFVNSCLSRESFFWQTMSFSFACLFVSLLGKQNKIKGCPLLFLVFFFLLVFLFSFVFFVLFSPCFLAFPFLVVPSPGETKQDQRLCPTFPSHVLLIIKQHLGTLPDPVSVSFLLRS